MSIRIKLFLSIFIVTVIISLITGILVYWQNNKKLIEHINSDLRDNLNYTSQLVNFYIDRTESDLSKLAKDPLMIEVLEKKDPAKIAQVSERLTIVNENSDAIGSIGLHEVIGSTCLAIAGDKTALLTVGRDWSNRDYCKGIVQTKAPYLSSAFIGTIEKKPVLAMVVPVKNSKKEMLGYIIGSVNLSEIYGYLWDLQEDSKVELLDRYGTMFLSTYEKIEILNNLSSTENVEINLINKKIFDNKKEGYFRHGEEFIGYKSNGPITVIYEKSATQVLTVINILNTSIIWAQIVGLFLIMILIYLAVGTITGRILRLSNATQQIASGNFDLKLKEKDLEIKDEIGILARSFNEMAEKLADFYKNLEEKIRQRTKEVEEKNKILGESEKSLKRALELSERTTKIMVGRELEMKQLKQEILELKDKCAKNNL